MIDMQQLINQETGGGVAGAMASATQNVVDVVIQPGRVAWAMRTLQESKIATPQAFRTDDGSVTFAVVEDSPAHSILVQIRDYQPKAKTKRVSNPLSGMSFYFWAMLACGVLFVIIGAWFAGAAVVLFSFAVGIPERRIRRKAKRLFDDNGDDTVSIKSGADMGEVKKNTDAHLWLMIWAAVLFVALLAIVLIVGGVL